MRKLILSLAAAAAVATGAFFAPAEAAPLASQSAMTQAADSLAPTTQVRWRRHGVSRARVVYRPHVVYRRHVVWRKQVVRPVRYAPRTRYVRRGYAPPPTYYYDEPEVYAPAPVYVPGPVYAPAYLPPRVMSAPVVIPRIGGGWGHRGGGFARGFGHRHR